VFRVGFCWFHDSLVIWPIRIPKGMKPWPLTRSGGKFLDFQLFVRKIPQTYLYAQFSVYLKWLILGFCKIVSSSFPVSNPISQELFSEIVVFAKSGDVFPTRQVGRQVLFTRYKTKLVLLALNENRSEKVGEIRLRVCLMRPHGTTMKWIDAGCLGCTCTGWIKASIKSSLTSFNPFQWCLFHGAL